MEGLPDMDGNALGERQLRRLIEVGRALTSELDLETVLQGVLGAARELTGARYAAVGILDPPGRELERFIVSGIDPAAREAIGDLPRGRGVLGQLITHPEPLRLGDVAAHPSSYGFPANHPPMSTFLGVPIRIRGNVYGNLYLTEKEGGAEFSEADEESLVVLAQWAAIAIDNARATAADRLRHSIHAAERERTRWARELHDDTLQGIGALRVLLSSALTRGDPDGVQRVGREVVDRLADEIEKLRGLIVELRPAALDALGLEAAVESLVDRVETTAGVQVDRVVELAVSQELDPDIASTVYRTIQEALTNVTKHARAEHVELSLHEREGVMAIEVTDDGVGFDSGALERGYGLTGMRERLILVGGWLDVTSAPGAGTTLHASIPAIRTGAAAPG